MRAGGEAHTLAVPSTLSRSPVRRAVHSDEPAARKRTLCPQGLRFTDAMDGPIHTLANGLRVVICERPGTRTVATKVFVNAGSRYDGEQPGLAHCLEHLLFKGTANRMSQEIYAEIEAVGGRIDAQTAKEYVAF